MMQVLRRVVRRGCDWLLCQAILSLLLIHSNVSYGEGDRGPISFVHHGCSYSFVVNPNDPSKCPQLMQRTISVPTTPDDEDDATDATFTAASEDDKLSREDNRAPHVPDIASSSLVTMAPASSDVVSAAAAAAAGRGGAISTEVQTLLMRKVQTLEKLLAMETSQQRKMNKTLSMQTLLLRHTEKKLSHHQRKLSVLARHNKETQKVITRQKLFNKNIDHKLSSVVLDVEELTRTVENAKTHTQADVQEKTIPVEAAPEVRDCNVPAGTQEFADCTDVYQRGHSSSGVYYVTPMYSHCPIPVWCDMDTPGGGWLIIQRRFNGKVRFDRDWETYRKGFGDVTKELWLGNANIFLLTNQKYYELRVDMWDFAGSNVYAVYKHFKIDGERDWYKLHISNHSGTAPDGLGNHNGIFFSTKDADHDRWADYHCAKEWKGGWWYNNCWFVILNGPYYNSSKVKYRGMSWNDWKPEQLQRVEMKIRPTTY